MSSGNEGFDDVPANKLSSTQDKNVHRGRLTVRVDRYGCILLAQRRRRNHFDRNRCRIADRTLTAHESYFAWFAATQGAEQLFVERSAGNQHLAQGGIDI